MIERGWKNDIRKGAREKRDKGYRRKKAEKKRKKGKRKGTSARKSQLPTDIEPIITICPRIVKCHLVST